MRLAGNENMPLCRLSLGDRRRDGDGKIVQCEIEVTGYATIIPQGVSRASPETQSAARGTARSKRGKWESRYLGEETICWNSPPMLQSRKYDFRR